MSDDRLFASNNAIGRKWYFINIAVLALITVITNQAFTGYIIPNVRTEVYDIIAHWIMYFAYVIYLITFFALIDRRLYDICGARDTKEYANTSAVLKLAVCFQTIILIGQFAGVSAPVSYELLQGIAWILNIIFLIITFCLGLLKGKISNLTHDEYKKRLKYKL